MLVAERGRLLDRVEAWDEGTGSRLRPRVRVQGARAGGRSAPPGGSRRRGAGARGLRRRRLREERTRSCGAAAGRDRRPRAHGRRYDGRSPRAFASRPASRSCGHISRQSPPAAPRPARSLRTSPSSSPTRQRGSTRRDTRPGSRRNADGSATASPSGSVSPTRLDRVSGLGRRSGESSGRERGTAAGARRRDLGPGVSLLLAVVPGELARDRVARRRAVAGAVDGVENPGVASFEAVAGPPAGSDHECEVRVEDAVVEELVTDRGLRILVVGRLRPSDDDLAAV